MMFAGSAIVLALATPAFAVHTANEPKAEGVWLMWVSTIVMAGAIGAILFKNAKRSHQD